MGTATLPNVHDGSLIGLLVPSSERALLTIRDISNTIHYIEMTGVERLLANEFMQGNIILDLSVETGEKIQSHTIAQLLDVKEDGPYAEHLSKVMERFKSRELLLVQISSSYGCDLQCICTGIGMSAAGALSLDSLFASNRKI
jgi:hypothetical protein